MQDFLHYKDKLVLKKFLHTKVYYMFKDIWSCEIKFVGISQFLNSSEAAENIFVVSYIPK